MPVKETVTKMKVVHYEGDRIYLRPLEVEDEPVLRVWINDPRNWRTLGRRRPVNRLVEMDWLENVHKSETDVVFGIVVREEDRLIGSAGLHRIHWVSRVGTFGLAIGDVDSQGRGYGTEATKLVVRYGFTTLNLHRIQLDVFSHNPRAIRAYEKAGFVFEGRLREAFYSEGKYVDVLRYGLLQPEWEKGNEDVLRRCDARVAAGRIRAERAAAYG
jgi:RimJ/RimL family protein N-acetyltransferase